MGTHGRSIPKLKSTNTAPCDRFHREMGELAFTDQSVSEARLHQDHPASRNALDVVHSCSMSPDTWSAGGGTNDLPRRSTSALLKTCASLVSSRHRYMEQIETTDQFEASKSSLKAATTRLCRNWLASCFSTHQGP